MPLIAAILLWVLDVFRLILLVRVVLDWVRTLNPSFKPRGLFLVLAELTYTLTDWVIKPLSKLIKPIRAGGGYLDLSVLALFVLLIILESLLKTIV